MFFTPHVHLQRKVHATRASCHQEPATIQATQTCKHTTAVLKALRFCLHELRMEMQPAKAKHRRICIVTVGRQLRKPRASAWQP